MLTLQLNTVRPCVNDDKTLPTALEWNTGHTIDMACHFSKPIIVSVHINGQPVCALLDSGSLSDFMSTTLADQLKLKTDILTKPLPVQLAVSGSCTKVNDSTTAQHQYQTIDEQWCFDIMNLDGYDLILGTLFTVAQKSVSMFEHFHAIASL